MVVVLLTLVGVVTGDFWEAAVCERVFSRSSPSSSSWPSCTGGRENVWRKGKGRGRGGGREGEESVLVDQFLGQIQGIFILNQVVTKYGTVKVE